MQQLEIGYALRPRHSGWSLSQNKDKLEQLGASFCFAAMKETEAISLVLKMEEMGLLLGYPRCQMFINKKPSSSIPTLHKIKEVSKTF